MKPKKTAFIGGGKKTKSSEKKENKQIVEIHIYVHQVPQYNFNGTGGQGTRCPICGNFNCGQTHVTC